MNNLRVAVDCDGVLAAWNPAYIKLIREAGFECPDESDDFPNVWFYDKQAGMTPEAIKKMWSKIEADPGFWLRLSPYPDAIEFLNEIDVLPIDLYFITNRPGIQAKWQTEQWLRSYGVRNPTVLITAKKAEACNLLDIDYYIDDYDINCTSVAISCTNSPKTFMLVRPWNTNCITSDRVIGIMNVQQFLDAIKIELSSRKAA